VQLLPPPGEQRHLSEVARMMTTGRAEAGVFYAVVMACAIALPLAAWKAVDVVVWLCSHLVIGWTP
jgi:hypothetical protein